MAKITKSSLKSLVKECLVEILQEGISDQPARARSSSKRSYPVSGASKSRGRISENRRSSALDSISYGSAERKQQNTVANESFEKNVNHAIGNLTSDSVMSSIFADTARTTLQEQVEGPAGSAQSAAQQGDLAHRKMSQSDPMDLFGGAASKWADLAFSE